MRRAALCTASSLRGALYFRGEIMRNSLFSVFLVLCFAGCGNKTNATTSAAVVNPSSRPIVNVNDLDAKDAMNESKIGTAGRFVLIKAGAYDWEVARRQARGRVPDPLSPLSMDFEMQATELTQLQYVLIMGANPVFRDVSDSSVATWGFSGFRAVKDCDEGNYAVLRGIEMCKNHPVELSMCAALQLIQTLNETQSEFKYRLPLEKEWINASRAGAQAMPHMLESDSDYAEINEHAWWAENAGRRTHQVASKNPNPFGLYDMFGNVEEWIGFFDYEEQTRSGACSSLPYWGGRFATSLGGNYVTSLGYLRSTNTTSELFETRVGARLARTRLKSPTP